MKYLEGLGLWNVFDLGGEWESVVFNGYNLVVLVFLFLGFLKFMGVFGLKRDLFVKCEVDYLIYLGDGICNIVFLYGFKMFNIFCIIKINVRNEFL